MKIKKWIVAFISLFLFDYLWHGLVFVHYYQTQAADILRFVNGVFAPDLMFAAIANVIFAIGFAAFVDVNSGTTSARAVVSQAALLGFVVSGFMNTYNYTIFRGLPLSVIGLDTLYGIVAGAFVGYVLYLCRRWFRPV